MLLEGKKAVVTGGTRGIGFAIVETFLKNGASVALFGSRQETVDKALAKLKAENPDWDVICMAPDLTDYAAVDAAMAKVTEAFGRIDILVITPASPRASRCTSMILPHSKTSWI